MYCKVTLKWQKAHEKVPNLNNNHTWWNDFYQKDKFTNCWWRYMVKALVGMEFGVPIMENSMEFHKYRTTICPRKNVSGKIIRITFKEIIKKVHHHRCSLHREESWAGLCPPASLSLQLELIPATTVNHLKSVRWCECELHPPAQMNARLPGVVPGNAQQNSHSYDRDNPVPRSDLCLSLRILS